MNGTNIRHWLPSCTAVVMEGKCADSDDEQVCRETDRQKAKKGKTEQTVKNQNTLTTATAGSQT